jgi:hypothetical protein
MFADRSRAGVRYVLEGAFAATATGCYQCLLIDTSTGAHRWAERVAARRCLCSAGRGCSSNYRDSGCPCEQGRGRAYIAGHQRLAGLHNTCGLRRLRIVSVLVQSKDLYERGATPSAHFQSTPVMRAPTPRFLGPT